MSYLRSAFAKKLAVSVLGCGNRMALGGLLAVCSSHARAQEVWQPPTVARAEPSEASSPSVITRNLTALPQAPIWRPGDPTRPVNPRRHYNREQRVLRIPRPAPNVIRCSGFKPARQPCLPPHGHLIH